MAMALTIAYDRHVQLRTSTMETKAHHDAGKS
jgi:hypothetical protein